MKEQLMKNLTRTSTLLKYYIEEFDKNKYFENLEVVVDDKDYNNQGDLLMVGFLLTFETTDLEEDLTSFASFISDLNHELYSILEGFKIDYKGNMTKPENNKSISYVGEAMIYKLSMSNYLTKTSLFIMFN